MKTDKDLQIFTDGGARGNPGPAAIGVVVNGADGKNISKIKKYIGEKTNNEAEYEAVIAALGEAVRLGAKKVEFKLDSELVVRQLNSIYKIKQPHIQKLVLTVRNKEQSLGRVTYSYIPREKNKAADKLVNEALDEAVGSRPDKTD